MSSLPGRVLALSAVLAGLAAGAAPAPALAQNNVAQNNGAQSSRVSGSYQSTCYNDFVVNGTLAATCRRDGGGVNDATLYHVEDCVGDIANHDGQLTCDKRSHGSSAVAAGAVVGALIGLAIAAGANGKSNGSSGAGANTTQSVTAPVTTQTQGGFHTSGTRDCGVGVPLYIAFRMGGDPNALWPIILDKDSSIDVQLPPGTTEAANCGAPPGPTANWVYPKVH
jgi:hypothetical protein